MSFDREYFINTESTVDELEGPYPTLDQLYTRTLIEFSAEMAVKKNTQCLEISNTICEDMHCE